jgi:uncharacterized membrane protein
MENEQNATPMSAPMQNTNPTTTPAPTVNTPPGEVPTLDNTTLMAILCYIGPLVIIPFLMAKEQPFVKFHIKQGIVLAAGGLVLYVLSQFYMLTYIPLFSTILTLISLGLLILSIVGIMNVVKKKEVDIPLTGQFTKHFNI